MIQDCGLNTKEIKADHEMILHLSKKIDSLQSQIRKHSRKFDSCFGQFTSIQEHECYKTKIENMEDVLYKISVWRDKIESDMSSGLISKVDRL